MLLGECFSFALPVTQESDTFNKNYHSPSLDSVTSWSISFSWFHSLPRGPRTDATSSSTMQEDKQNGIGKCLFSGTYNME